jgi:monovalent cation/hydrogen antiporter
MTGAQSFLLFLIVLGGAATMLRLVSRSTPTVPYPVLLAVGGILIGLVPGLRIPAIGSELILLVFVPGLVFEASLAVDLAELRRRVVPVALLATLGVFLTVFASSTHRRASRRYSRARASSTTALASPSLPLSSAPS